MFQLHVLSFSSDKGQQHTEAPSHRDGSSADAWGPATYELARSLSVAKAMQARFWRISFEEIDHKERESSAFSEPNNSVEVSSTLILRR
ncbi:hypothetical protein PDIDSM_2266 [Penicillium digitatum]|nr:hypothetical protein PDIDSM_2266 [Penicillium digitatum]